MREGRKETLREAGASYGLETFLRNFAQLNEHVQRELSHGVVDQLDESKNLGLYVQKADGLSFSGLLLLIC